MHGEAKRNLEFIGGKRDRQLQQLWAETKIGDILPWEDVEREAERLLESTRANARNSENSDTSQGQDDDRAPIMRLSSGEGVLTRLQLNGPARLCTYWSSSALQIKDKITENWESVGHWVLVKSLDTVAKEAEGESAGLTVKLIIFVGSTCGSVHVQTLNSNLKELGVVESKRNTIQRGFVHELLNAQDTVLCSYYAQRMGTKNDGCGQRSEGKKSFKDWKDLNDN